MSDLYKLTDFMISGGALESLVEFLVPRVQSALIVAPKDLDLEILEAIGTRASDLILPGQAASVTAAFPPRPLAEKFSVHSAEIGGDWPWAVRICGRQWAIYILLRQRPDDRLLDEIWSPAGLIYLWKAFNQIDDTEQRLASLSYMILATKNTLASIFEPMTLDYYAAFLVDVLNESLFPKSLTIYRDNGKTLSYLKGANKTAPAREGLYAQAMLSPVPVITRRVRPYEVVLPIPDAQRLFCVSEWEAMPTQDALNFMELVGSLASRSLTLNSLQRENMHGKMKISSDEFSIMSLTEALNALKKEKDKSRFLAIASDVFMECSQISELFLVLWDSERQGYMPYEYRKSGERVPYGQELLKRDPVISKPEKPFFNLEKDDFSKLLDCPWAEMARMRYVFPFWNHERMEGFAALAHGPAHMDNHKRSTLEALAQFMAFDWERFDAAGQKKAKH